MGILCIFVCVGLDFFFPSSARLVLVGGNNFILKEVSANLARMYLLQLYLLPIMRVCYCDNLSARDFIPGFECKDG